MRNNREIATKDLANINLGELLKTSSVSVVLSKDHFQGMKLLKMIILNLKLEFIDRYKDKCLCINKDRIGTELRKILSKYQ